MARELRIRGYTVGQMPNPPLWVAFVALVVALIASGGTIDDLARTVFYLALAIWGYGEATEGVNGFRKALGVAALVLVLISVARAIG